MPRQAGSCRSCRTLGNHEPSSLARGVRSHHRLPRFASSCRGKLRARGKCPRCVALLGPGISHSARCRAFHVRSKGNGRSPPGASNLPVRGGPSFPARPPHRTCSARLASNVLERSGSNSARRRRGNLARNFKGSCFGQAQPSRLSMLVLSSRRWSPNPSIERTSLSWLRQPKDAAHVER